MKYKLITFSMTLAKRISDGSVRGRIRLYSIKYCYVGTARFLLQNEEGYAFELRLSVNMNSDEIRKELNVETVDSLEPPVVYFNEDGTSEHTPLKLIIEIPVEDSYDDDCCNANSGIKEMQELQKELQKDGHYHKCKIEPIEYILTNNLGFCEGNVVKYITRYKDKGGVDDLRKIKIYVDYLIDELTDKD